MPTLGLAIKGEYKDMSIYKVSLSKEDISMKEKRKIEEMLNDLLVVLPTLEKHKLHGEIQKKVRVLRDGRKQKHYTLELSRKCNTYEGLEPKTGTTKYHLPQTAKKLGLDNPYFEVDEIIEQHPIASELKVTAPLTKEEAHLDGKTKRVPVNKTKVLANLKAQIITQVQEIRKKQKVVKDEHVFKEGLKVPKLGDVYLEPNTFIKLIDKKIRFNMKNVKTPIDKNSNYVGIELEFAAKEDRETVCDILHQENLGKYVHVKNDGSIGRSFSSDKITPMMKEFKHGHEIAILVKESELEEVLTKLCSILNNRLHVQVDHTCGLHVHLDMRRREVAKSFSNLIAMQHFLFAMVPANRKNNKYSVPVKDRKFAPGSIGDRDGHYDGVSQSAYNKYGTLEMRMHCGTTQANKIINWVKLLMAIADAPTIGDSPKTLSAARPGVNISDSLLEYCESRIAKFAKEHKVGDKKTHSWMTEVEPVLTTPDRTSLEEQSEVA